MTEPTCDDCGRPASICNARAMIEAAIERHGAAVVARGVYDLLAVHGERRAPWDTDKARADKAAMAAARAQDKEG